MVRLIVKKTPCQGFQCFCCIKRSTPFHVFNCLKEGDQHEEKCSDEIFVTFMLIKP